MHRKNWFWGIAFILIAAGLIAWKLGFTFYANPFTILISVVLAGVAVSGLRRLEWFTILFPIAVIYLIYQTLLTQTFGYQAIDTWTILLATALLATGLSILFRRHHNHKYDFEFNYDRDKRHRRKKKWKNDDDTVYFDNEETKDASSVIDYSVRFSEGIKYVYSENFQRATLDCSMGELKVYFTDAKVSPEGAFIDMNCSFGELAIYIPSGWNIVEKLTYSMGDIRNHGQNINPQGPVVELRGSCSFGNIDIYYV